MLQTHNSGVGSSFILGGPAVMCVVLLDREGGGGGGGVLGDSLKACCNTVMQFAEFMHAGNNIVEGQAPQNQAPLLRILGGPVPPLPPYSYSTA